MSEAYESNLATAKAILTTIGSVAATAMVARTVVRECVPQELQEYLSSGLWRFLDSFSNQLTMVVDEFDGMEKNEIYEAAEVYLGPKIAPTTRRLKISKQEKDKSFNLAMEKGEEITEIYNGVKLNWVWIARKVEASRNFYHPGDMNATLKSEVRSFELTFHKKNQDFVMNVYLPFIVNEAKLRKRDKKTIKIHTVDYEQMYDMNSAWISTSLDHPATFDTLAMDAEKKDMILNDLKRFVKRREYYRKVGKAWKRGYLLYGPPGTGKSSLIAAIANFLNFDIYDLELTEVRKNSDLRKLLVATANKSVLVVEDIDCTIDFQDRLSKNPAAVDSDPEQNNLNKVTLSGFLNFIDGLWSSCGDERIIIFTTNHREKLDPALLRPGRMDVHIHMSYCTPGGFRILAANYLDIKNHFLFEEIEGLIAPAQVTPAEVAEQLLKNDEVDVALQGLIDFLHVKRKEIEEAKAKKVLEVETKDDEETKENVQQDREKEVPQPEN